jgi:hypothetical protein
MPAWYIVFAISAISGYPLGFTVEPTTYPTREICLAALPARVHVAQKAGEPQHQIVSGAACAMEDAIPEDLRKQYLHGRH